VAIPIAIICAVQHAKDGNSGLLQLRHYRIQGEPAAQIVLPFADPNAERRQNE
jgi:hypothetical protein